MLLYLQTLPGICNEKTSWAPCQHHIIFVIQIFEWIIVASSDCVTVIRCSGMAANYREERMLCIFLQILCYHDSKTHAGIISNAGITFSGYDESGERESLAPELLSLLPAAMRGGSVIKMASVMGLITIIVSNTRLKVLKCLCLG